MKTFNKKGDTGSTSLLFGGRVSKADLHCEAYGTIDEAASALGVARNLAQQNKTREIILKVQKELFIINAELAVTPENYPKFTERFQPLAAERADELEALIDEIEAGLAMPRAFIIPGANLASATLDVSRTIVRRVERRVVTLQEAGEIKNEAILRYLNRLADLLFTLARYEET